MSTGDRTSLKAKIVLRTVKLCIVIYYKTFLVALRNEKYLVVMYTTIYENNDFNNIIM